MTKRPRKRSGVVVELVRLVAVGLFAALGFQVGTALSEGHTGSLASPLRSGASGAFLGVVLGTAIGFVAGGVAGRSTASALRGLEREVAELSGADVLAGLFGAVAGIVAGFVIAVVLLLLVPVAMIAYAGGAFVLVVLGYLGYRLGRQKRDDVVALLGLRGRLGPGGPAAKLIDTSALIDGRLLGIAKANFFDGRVIVPAFMLAELQGIADAADPGRRARGRRGLDVLALLGKQAGIELEFEEQDYPDVQDVDAKLIRLAREQGLALVTTDANLARVAELSGIVVLNVNALAETVRVSLQQGERVRVLIEKAGREGAQGVGYLDDGTMVVIEGARKMIGEVVDATVTTVLQTAQGRMGFARLTFTEALQA